MVMQTKFFGEVNIADEKLITLVNGLPGFEDYTKYVILYDSEKSAGDGISWFQSAEEPTLALPVVNPLFIRKDYNPIVDDALLEPLGDPGEEGFFVLVTMRIPEDPEQVTCNLKAPIVINPKTLLGCQIIVENEDYPIRFNIYKAVQKLKEKAGD